MAKGKKTGGRNFQPGVVTNPNGRPKIPEELKVVRKFTKYEIERILSSALELNVSELKLKLKDPDLRVIDKIVYEICIKAIEGGDPLRFNFLLDRLVGKVKEPSQDINVNFNSMPTEKLIELGKEAITFLSGGSSGNLSLNHANHLGDPNNHQDS